MTRKPVCFGPLCHKVRYSRNVGAFVSHSSHKKRSFKKGEEDSSHFFYNVFDSYLLPCPLGMLLC